MVSDEAINESFILATIYDNVLITSYLFPFTRLYQLSYCTMKRHEMKGSDLEYGLILSAQFGYMKYVKLLMNFSTLGEKFDDYFGIGTILKEEEK